MMRNARRLLLTTAAIALAVVLAGCGREESSTAQGPDAGREAVEDSAQEKTEQQAKEDDGRRKGYLELTTEQPKRVEQKMQLTGVRQALEAFKALEGRYPRSLDELKQAGMPVPEPPTGYHYKYDPETGSVSLVQQ